MFKEPADTPPDPSAPADAARPARVLVVDDDPPTLDIIATQLGMLGHTALQARTLEEARRILEGGTVDIVFADIYLKNENGLDLLPEVARLRRPLPVIVMTALPDLTVGAEALRRRAFDFIVKPFHKELLRCTILRAQSMLRLADGKRRAEETRERQRRFLAAVLSTLDDALISLDGMLNVVTSNPAADRICGRLRADSPDDPPDAGCRCLAACRQVLETGQAVRGLRVECDHGGRSRIFSLNAEPISAPAEERGVLAILKDMSRLDYLERRLDERQSMGGMVGRNGRMREVYGLVETLGGIDTTVLILGESGTGKELAAEAIHQHSARAAAPLVRVNCSALTESLLEAELFGAVRGAYTSATADRKGRFEMADGGTLFLDEIGDLSLHVQMKLLRAIQEKTIERVGDPHPLRVDARIVAATNKNLALLVKRGLFRSDLYYRLNVVELRLPPLRDRLDDLPLLVDHFIGQLNRLLGRRILGATPAFLACLARHDWPGNVRELKHAVEHACVFCPGDRLDTRHLPAGIGEPEPPEPAVEDPSPPPTVSSEHLRTLLEEHGWNRALTARALGVSRMTVYRWIRKYELEGSDKE